jgi:hypothetical protein
MYAPVRLRLDAPATATRATEWQSRGGLGGAQC